MNCPKCKWHTWMDHDKENQVYRCPDCGHEVDDREGSE